MSSNRAILATALVLLLTVALFETTGWDLALQDRLYDAVHGWYVDRDAHGPRLIFYDVPKLAVELLAAFLLVCAVVPTPRSPRWPLSRREAAFLLVCLAVIPLAVGVLKKTTGVFGPWKIARYGGTYPYRSLLESIPYVPGQERGRGFPAGHCSGGFALMGLYFVGSHRTTRVLGVILGLAAGWSVGVYQILKGAHYLSHTVVTMILAWLIVQLLSRAFRLGEGSTDPPAA
jgi:membrane-associated PAP2 superfamily phosphatase